MNPDLCLHPFRPHRNPAWGDFCVEPNPDENNEPCGWTRDEHND